MPLISQVVPSTPSSPARKAVDGLTELGLKLLMQILANYAYTYNDHSTFPPSEHPELNREVAFCLDLLRKAGEEVYDDRCL